MKRFLALVLGYACLTIAAASCSKDDDGDDGGGEAGVAGEGVGGRTGGSGGRSGGSGGGRTGGAAGTTSGGAAGSAEAGATGTSGGMAGEAGSRAMGGMAGMMGGMAGMMGGEAGMTGEAGSGGAAGTPGDVGGSAGAAGDGAAGAAAGAAGAGSGGVVSFGPFALEGCQEVPANASAATGTAVIEVDTATNTLSYVITFTDLSAPETVAHIHGPAERGENATPIISLPAGSTKEGTATLTDEQEAQLLAGQMYVNVHSEEFPAGEIRGQIDDQGDCNGIVVFDEVVLEGCQEVPANASTATGAATITLDTTTNTLEYDITFSGLSADETVAHIHGPAERGANATPIITLPAGSPKTGSAELTDEQEAQLLAGQMYVNVHSEDFSAGEIRGQIDDQGGCNGVVTFDIVLEGCQEVPPNDSTATGSAVISVELSTSTLSYDITFSGLSADETVAHIHGPAERGENATPIITLPAGSPKEGSAELTEEELADVLAGLTYVNVHSQDFPQGEIRGQIDNLGVCQ